MIQGILFDFDGTLFDSICKQIAAPRLLLKMLTMLFAQRSTMASR